MTLRLTPSRRTFDAETWSAPPITPMCGSASTASPETAHLPYQRVDPRRFGRDRVGRRGAALVARDRIHAVPQRSAEGFSWLPSVPQGRVRATFSIGTEIRESTGSGYQDHDWGTWR